MCIDERLTDHKKNPPRAFRLHKTFGFKKTMVKSILKFVYFERKGGFNELNLVAIREVSRSDCQNLGGTADEVFQGLDNFE
jgi:hypothetical protein